MSLRIKFNIVMVAVFLAGLVLAALFFDRYSRESAREAILSEARLMIGQVDATIHYTGNQVSPLLAKPMSVQFLPQAIPFYAAQQSFDALAKAFPDYSFRQPTLNPTNPSDKPADWEADIIQTFAAQPSLASLVTERETKAGRILSYSRPTRVDSQECLACHSTPDKAPPSMIDVYGRNNGFGWKLGNIIGAEIVSVPERVALGRARSSLLVIMGSLVAVFAAMLALLNLMLHLFIIKPVRRVSQLADEISLGNMAVPEFDAKGKDEIGSLSRSFNRMRRSLTSALRLLEES
jgi:HAMP domain-containing protein